MAGLVGHDLDVVLGAVEVGKNKRHFVIAQARAVATARLAGGGQHVHELVVQHFVEEHAGLGGKLLIELFALLEDASASPPGGGCRCGTSGIVAAFIGYCLPSRPACSR